MFLAIKTIKQKIKLKSLTKISCPTNYNVNIEVYRERFLFIKKKLS
jgi:hypothetical protein